jgi:glutathione S-transferase
MVWRLILVNSNSTTNFIAGVLLIIDAAFGLFDTKALKVDEILEFVEDVTRLLTPSVRMQDPAQKAEVRAHLAANVLPPQFAAIEKALERNNSSPYAIGSQLSIADLKLGGFCDWFRTELFAGLTFALIEPYPRLAALANAFIEHPKIKEWYAAHPPVTYSV